MKTSGSVYVPSAISSFFEICDTESNGTKISDPLRIGARGGGFILQRGSVTLAETGREIQKDQVIINERNVVEAKTTLRVLQLMRQEYDIAPVRVRLNVEPPIGSGFGTSGAGAIGTSVAVSDLFDLRLTLVEASRFAHIAEIDSVTGLGTVISLVSGSGALGLVTEPGCYSIGRVDSILEDYHEYSVFCACFGSIEKSTVLKDEAKRQKVNEYGRKTLESILDEGTMEGLLRYSRIFAEKTGLASAELLKLADKSISLGAIGATQNMIGNAIHCLVPKSKRSSFLLEFERLVPGNKIFESELSQGGPVLTKNGIGERLRNT